MHRSQLHNAHSQIVLVGDFINDRCNAKGGGGGGGDEVRFLWRGKIIRVRPHTET